MEYIRSFDTTPVSHDRMSVTTYKTLLLTRDEMISEWNCVTTWYLDLTYCWTSRTVFSLSVFWGVRTGTLCNRYIVYTYIAGLLHAFYPTPKNSPLYSSNLQWDSLTENCVRSCFPQRGVPVGPNKRFHCFTLSKPEQTVYNAEGYPLQQKMGKSQFFVGVQFSTSWLKHEVTILALHATLISRYFAVPGAFSWIELWNYSICTYLLHTKEYFEQLF